MIFSLFFLILSFAALYFGAEWLVKGSSQLARATGIKPVIIALTIVAFGTSAPELVVTVNASMAGTENIALGNIIGSVIANIALILGISAIIRPINIEFRLLKTEIPIMLACELIFFLLIWNLNLSRYDGIILLSGFVLFNWFYIREARKNIKEEKERVQNEYKEYVSRPKKTSNLLNLGMIVLGIISLIFGSHLVIKEVTQLASFFGISEYIISASIVAFGTSIPELATSVMAAVRGEFDISVGNILGSNIFNIFMCLGAASVVRPLTVQSSLLRYDAPFMIILSLILGITMWTKMKISRLEGVILLLFYGAYLFYLFH